MPKPPAKASQARKSSTGSPERPARPKTRGQVGAELLQRAADRKDKGKPRVTTSTARGAVAGASTGGMIGSIVPGVGTAAGGAVGAAIGGTAGAVQGHRAKRDYKRGQAGGAGASVRRVLVAEFVVCMIILGLSPLASSTDRPVDAKQWMKRGTATCALFLVLGLVSSGSNGMAKISAAFGGLVTLALMVDQRNLFGIIAKKLGAPASSTAEESDAGGPPNEDAGIGTRAGQAALIGAGLGGR